MRSPDPSSHCLRCTPLPSCKPQPPCKHLSSRRFTSLRRNYFVLILIEENLATADAASIDLIYQNAGIALVLEPNLALSSPVRTGFFWRKSAT
jgi:hypothetical protein